MPPAAIELLAKHHPLFIAGTTAAGKETIIQAIHETGHGAKVVTHTTRRPRPGEHNGKDYWFVSDARMLELIEEESFIEIKAIHDQQISGSSLAAYQTVVDEGQTPIVEIDVQGIEEIMRQAFNLKAVFILPPNFETWMERLKGRGNMSYVERQRRMHSAQVELEKALHDEHFMLVVNHDVRETAKEIIDGVTDVTTQHRNRELAQQLIDHIKSY
jgi:guanylate kinase